MLTVESLFDERYYLETNPTVAATIADGNFASALEHFETIGVDEGLRFTPLIDLDYYKRVANPDLTSLSNREALDHLLSVGIEDGRLFSQFIDLEFYQEANPDLADLSHSEALIHLRDIGLEAGLEFSATVDLAEYRSFNPELAALNLSDAFTHLATLFVPEDTGRIRIPLSVGRFASVDSVNIVTPETLAGSSEAIFTYSKAANQVTLELNIEGLPFRPTFTRPEDVSTPFYQQPVSVEEGKWQLFLITRFAETTFWYDGQSGGLIGNEFDIFDQPIPADTPIDIDGDGIDEISIVVPANQAIGTPLFDGNPDGTTNVTFDFEYDQLLDEIGTAGVFGTAAVTIPFNLNRPDETGIYYTQGGLPVSEASSWDDVIATIRNTQSFPLFLSLVPDPKPDYLAARDSTMIAHVSIYPNVTPQGVVFDPLTNTYRFAEATDLVTNSVVAFPTRLGEIARESEAVFGSTEADDFDAANPSDSFDGNYDTLLTGAGDDFVDASQATAPLFPSTSGRNRIYSGTGLDELLAGHRDRLSGGTDNDILDASLGSGRNRLYGGAGNDQLSAGGGDRLFGGDGDDVLDATAGNGNNRLYGQDGNDTFFAGGGDRLIGGDGDDTVFLTDRGDNLITGGTGADTFWIATGEVITTPNTITDFALDADVIGVAGLGATSINDLEIHQVSNNTIIAFSGFDLATLLNTQAAALATNGTFVFA